MSRPKFLLVATAMVAALTVIPATTASAATTHYRPHKHHRHYRHHAGYSGPCHAAVDAYWPAQHQAFAHYVVNRESHGFPSAANAHSSARGCFQMLLRYSAPYYRAVGCTNAMWANATCNVRAAYVMFQKAGRSPWAMPVRRSSRRR